MNRRTKEPNGSAPADAAFGANNDPKPSSGPPLVVVEAAGAVLAERPNSRRVNANAVHINGPASVLSPAPVPDSHDNKFAPMPSTDVVAAGLGAAVMPGEAAAAAAGDTATAGPPERETVSPATDSAVDDPVTVVAGAIAWAGRG